MKRTTPDIREHGRIESCSEVLNSARLRTSVNKGEIRAPRLWIWKSRVQIPSVTLNDNSLAERWLSVPSGGRTCGRKPHSGAEVFRAGVSPHGYPFQIRTEVPSPQTIRTGRRPLP